MVYGSLGFSLKVVFLDLDLAVLGRQGPFRVSCPFEGMEA